MEENENVANLRAATAVFNYDRRRWWTEGRAIQNLNPTEAVQFYQANLELVAQESPAGHRRTIKPREGRRGVLRLRRSLSAFPGLSGSRRRQALFVGFGVLLNWAST